MSDGGTPQSFATSATLPTVRVITPPSFEHLFESTNRYRHYPEVHHA